MNNYPTGLVPEISRHPDDMIPACNDTPIPLRKPIKVHELCEKCQKVFEGWPYELNENCAEYFPHHGGRRALEASANCGCAVCAQLLLDKATISEWCDHPDYFNNEDPSVPDRDVNKSATPLHGEACIRKFGRYEILVILCMAYVKGSGDCKYDERSDVALLRERYVAILRPTNKLALYYDSPGTRGSTMDALPLCKRWLGRCLKLHKTCKPVVSHRLPTRLIDITGNEARICLGSELDSSTPYATLSHCWGSLEFMTLTKDNYESFRVRIPRDALTKTFREAIYSAQYLGFSYIWIDSLYWRRESGLMTSVYGGSTLNLGASSAEDGRIGLFFDRKRTWRCQLILGTDGKTNLYDCYGVNSNYPHEHLPLLNRAWVVQETYISRRMLHFYRAQIFWDCNEQPAYETYPDRYPPKNLIHAIFRKEDFSSAKFWPSIVARYSSAQLSKIGDKLVALGGLARAIQAQTNDTYVAGLWKSSLENDLLWMHPPGRQASRRLKPYQVPTWSWASIDGAAQIDQRDPGVVKFFIRVADLHMEYVDSNPFGQVVKAVLRLECEFLCPVIRRSGPGTHAMNLQMLAGLYETTLFADCSECQKDYPLYFLPGTHRDVNDSGRNGASSCGLLLRRVSPGNQFQRVGCCWISDYENVLARFDHAFQSADNQAKDSDFSEIKVDADGTVHRFIDII